MKLNGNNQKIKDYYIGLDVGTNSVGWAVTDTEYGLLRSHGKHLWGARLFDSSEGSKEQRVNRSNRRRLARRKQRLTILKLLFEEEISKIDPDFFNRLHESDRWQEDKRTDCRFSLFNDPGYTDKEYHNSYPTIYHLRSELANGNKPHDVRLVFLALHHLMKYRGHFLQQGETPEELVTPEQAFQDLVVFLRESYGQELILSNQSDFLAALQNTELKTQEKKKALREALGRRNAKNVVTSDSEPVLSAEHLCDLLAGGTVKLADLFQDESLKESEQKSISLKEWLEEEKEEALLALLEDRATILLLARDVYDAARLSAIRGEHKYLCDAKIALYEKNRKDTRILKALIREHAPSRYKHIFCEREENLNNFPAYSRYRHNSGEYACGKDRKQEKFCKFLEAELNGISLDTPEAQRILSEIKERTFLTKLRGTENGKIPYQLQKMEMKAILDNAASYLPFLNEADEDGNTCADKILKTFSFRIPYYVGPLNQNSPRGWCVRFPGKEGEQIKPWNFGQIVDTESTVKAFIENRIGLCSYTAEPVLPRNSLLYCEFTLRNELAPLRVNGHPLPHAVREQMIHDLFIKSTRRVTKKRLYSYLLSQGFISAGDELTGIDEDVNATLKSQRDMADIMQKLGDSALAEEIIRHIVIFGEDKRMLTRWLKNKVPSLGEDDLRALARLNYQDWGNLSAYFLTGITAELDGKQLSIMELFQETDMNLNQILSAFPSLIKEAEQHRNEHLGNSMSLTERLKTMYISPSVQRGIRQALAIVDEIVDIRKGAPAKIFIEMARGDKKDLEKKRMLSRKQQLQMLYASCKDVSRELADNLELEDDNSLRSNKLFLYYLQLGKCMYSGDPIDLGALMHGELFDRDHIFPRSKIKDDSLDNLVLVKNELNREKNNNYPIDESIREKMGPTWRKMKEAGLLSEKKYQRLIRNTVLTETELRAFDARQLVQTRQATLALATLLKEKYGEERIVYSKAGNVSEFRQYFKFYKCREVNDLHHAKDAYLNIVVGNVYDVRFTKQFFKNILREKYSIKPEALFGENTDEALKKNKLYQTVKDMLRRNDPIVTRMPHEAGGKLFNVTLQPAVTFQPASNKKDIEEKKDIVKKKAVLPIEQYGGYNNRYGAYFCAVEHTTSKGKRIRTLEPVFMDQKAQYEADPEQYFRDCLRLKDPIPIQKTILMDSMLEINGKRYYISGRKDEKTVRLEHAYQLILPSEQEELIRQAAKYDELCSTKKAEVPVQKGSSLTDESLLQLYDLFRKKCDEPIYSGLFPALPKHIDNNRDIFCGMTLLKKCQTLLQILKAFRCNAEKPNLKDLCGKETDLRITEKNVISSFQSVYLIHRSPTGIYEYKT
ncbi:MAG: type II CRISPR RNA-guided endonuclease Cas9, partial [bacterium]